MRRSLVTLVMVSGCLGTAPTGPFLTDDAGSTVDVGRLDRIVATSTDVAEIFALLGHGHRLAAIPAWVESATSCVRAPPGLEGIPRIGKPHTIGAESVVALGPSLVIEKDHPLQPTPLATQLRQAGLAVYVLDNEETLANVHHTVATIARILETVDPAAPANGRRLSADFYATLDGTATTLVSRPGTEPRALFQLPAGLVATQRTSGALLLDLAGAEDLGAATGLQGYRVMSPEALAQGDPERVVVSCTAATAPEALYGSPKYASTTAARLAPDSLRIVDPATAALVGPRFAQAVRETAEWLHPAAFQLIEPRVNFTITGRALTVDARGSAAANDTLTFRFDAGDGSGLVGSPTAVFHHNYTRTGTHVPRLYLVDSEGRIHEERRALEVTG